MDCVYSPAVEYAYDDEDKEALLSALLSLVNVNGNKVSLYSDTDSMDGDYSEFMDGTLSALLPLMDDKFATWTSITYDSKLGYEASTCAVMKDGAIYSIDDLVANLPR